MPRKETNQALEAFRNELRIIPHVPMVMTSAHKGVGIGKLLPMAEAMRKECEIRIGTGLLNRSLQAVLEKQQPPVVKRRRPKFFYVTQADEDIPTFVFFCNDHTLVKTSYARYLENQFRKMLGHQNRAGKRGLPLQPRQEGMGEEPGHPRPSASADRAASGSAGPRRAVTKPSTRPSRASVGKRPQAIGKRTNNGHVY